ncbi:hypothetical protein HII31_06584 [Pseudocercospora fuligena]|uniref:Uncharacterized protein n=1 Tax=Pseudocercospora fuligena TaxID=685502 RepID=A0A8H6RJC9_9PEZI|nr:hypothetical protein HII31_06584 [Pseudocercospora fuligena]
MGNKERKELLGTPQWDLENRAAAHLLFILYDLWPNHRDDLIRIFHRMFPQMQRVRLTISHLRDTWKNRWAAKRYAYVRIDRPNDRDRTPLTQAELNDLATLTSIIQRWAAQLGTTLNPPTTAEKRPYDDQAYDFSRGVADPNDNLSTYVNKVTGARAALRPGDSIPQWIIDIMTVGNQTDTKLEFGMPVDGLPAQLPFTIGHDVNEDGRPLHAGIAPQAPAVAPPPLPVFQAPPAQPAPAAQQAPAPPTQALAQQPAQKHLPSQANVVDLTGDSDDEDAQDSDLEAPITRRTRLTKRGRTSQPSRRRRQVYYDDDDEDDDESPGEPSDDEEDDDFPGPSGKRARTDAPQPRPQPQPMVQRGRAPLRTLMPKPSGPFIGSGKVGVAPDDAHLLPHKQIEMYRKGLTMDGRPLRPVQFGANRNANSVPVPFSKNYTRYTTTPNDDAPLFSDALDPPEQDIPAPHLGNFEGDNQDNAEDEEEPAEASDPEEVDDDQEAGLAEESDDEESEAEEEDEEDLYAEG